MQDYQEAFLDFAIGLKVLRFGEFTLKSGRVSPYFFNAGLFDRGAALTRLGRFYASAVVASGLEFDMLFGPAYKGIPLVSTLAVALADQHDRDLPFAFNRKEAKDHGEGGTIVGAPIQGRVLIVDDVISAGTSVREAVDLIRTLGGEPAGVVIALDRQERGRGERSAVQEVEDLFNLPVTTIVRMAEVEEYLSQRPELADSLAAMHEYRDRYGVEE